MTNPTAKPEPFSISDFYFTMFCIMFVATLFLPGFENYSFFPLFGWAVGTAILEARK